MWMGTEPAGFLVWASGRGIAMVRGIYRRVFSHWMHAAHNNRNTIKSLWEGTVESRPCALRYK